VFAKGLYEDVDTDCMESYFKPDWLAPSADGIFLVLGKFLVMCIAWLAFFYLVIFGWDLQLQQEETPQNKPPFERLLS
jgi:hypothetical protein